MTVLTIAALQIQNHSLGVASALEQILDSESELSSQRPFLVVAPEASIGGYPKGTGFGTFVGYRLEAGREEFRKYFNESIVVPGPETNELAGFSKRIGCFLTIGVIERAHSSLYCTVLTFSPVDGLVNSRRKLIPTAAERLVWGQGDGSKLSPVESIYGRLNSAVCWENYMPLMRAALYAKGVEFWCAPTMDDRDIWRSSMRHIATEGRCFLISACQFQPSPSSLGIKVASWDEDKPLVNGGSMIVGHWVT
ncbi:nitrilase-related carbon-nitrogen hydrolase [Kineobactrum salinum]|uniref:nitrilase-related carbon-nitrogen hydrolase n=1 Tax=Kineobactrum salinum TaxID=2708301 RepID=UPI0018D9CD47|nr:nitrilase-related carbon-nitrogen hydrolase [Kineobactrum salinum]